MSRGTASAVFRAKREPKPRPSGRGGVTAPTALRHLWAFLALFFAAWIGRVLLIPWTDAAVETPATARLIADLWRLALWLILPLVWLRHYEGLDPRAAIDQRPGWKPWLGWLLAALYLVASRGYEVYLGSHWHAIPAASVPVLAAALTGVAFAALCEEFLFRGLLLKEFRRRFGFWRANFLQAGLFVAIQWPAWLMLIELDFSTFALLSSLALLFGLFLGVLAALTGTILVGFLVQAVSNALQGLGFG